MMKYPHFMELSAEMKLQIVRKCKAIPYVRLRQTCQHMDDFCEAQRKWIGIYCYRDDPQLYLTDTLNISPFKQTRSSTDEDITEVHVVVNYGKNDGDHSFSVPMTEENTPNIRASLSGFHFLDIFLVSSAGDDEEKNKRYGEALCRFLQLASHLNSSYVTVRDLTAGQTQLALDTWKKTLGIGVLCSKTRMTLQSLKEIVYKDRVKKMNYCHYDISNDLSDLDNELLEQMTRGKRTVSLIFDWLSQTRAINVWNHLHRAWIKEGRAPNYFRFYFTHQESIFSLTPGFIFENNINLISFTKHELNFKEQTSMPRRYDLSMAKVSQYSRWQYIFAERIKGDGKTYVRFLRRSNLTKELFINSLFFYLATAYPGNAYDLSSLYDKLVELETPEQMKEEYSKMADELLRFYTETKAVETKEEVPVVLEISQ